MDLDGDVEVEVEEDVAVALALVVDGGDESKLSACLPYHLIHHRWA